MDEYNLIIVGGGAAGILCAIKATQQGIDKILLIEKDPVLGGALNLGDYNISKKNEITGKQYKQKLMEKLEKSKVELKLNTLVIKLNNDNTVLCTSPEGGLELIKGRNIILTNGGKEGARKALSMFGDRCSGILTIGMAKKILTMEGIIPGKNILIDGTASLHMIEKSFKERNLNVVGIITRIDNPKVFGLTDKVYSGYNVVAIQGEGRVEKVTISNGVEEKEIECDTLLFARAMLSDGLVAMRSNIILNPETTGPKVDERLMTSQKGVYACGNGIYIHKYIEEIEKECENLIKNM